MRRIDISLEFFLICYSDYQSVRAEGLSAACRTTRWLRLNQHFNSNLHRVQKFAAAASAAAAAGCRYLCAVFFLALDVLLGVWGVIIHCCAFL